MKGILAVIARYPAWTVPDGSQDGGQLGRGLIAY